MRRSAFFFSSALFLAVAVIPQSAFAVGRTCQYGSTQARVKNSGMAPWTQNLNIRCGESFEVGGFHDNSGQYANDVSIYVKGPNINWDRYNNGNTVTAYKAGTYYVDVRTNGQSGAACTDRAVVNVTCSNSENTCSYQSTQVRVKKPGINKPWQEDMVINSCLPQRVELGSFHDNSGTYASDTYIKVWEEGKPEDKAEYHNGQLFIAWPGKTYQVKAKTRNQSGETRLGDQCKDETTVRVVCSRLGR